MASGAGVWWSKCGKFKEGSREYQRPGDCPSSYRGAPSERGPNSLGLLGCNRKREAIVSNTTHYFVIVLPDNDLARNEGEPLPATFRGPMAAHQGARRRPSITLYAVAPATVVDHIDGVTLKVDGRNLRWVNAKACEVQP
jgi:hypothetical protein